MRPRTARGWRVVFGGLAIVAACAAVDPLALRPRLSPGLPLSLRTWKGAKIRKKADHETGPPGNTKRERRAFFGGLAIVAACAALDPWLCVPGFRRVCLFRYEPGKVRDN